MNAPDTFYSGILLLENPDNSSIRVLPDGEGSWHIIIIRQGSLRLSTPYSLLKCSRGVLILPPPIYTDGITMQPGFRGYALSIPGRLVSEMDFGSDMNLYSTVLTHPYAELTIKEAERICRYIILIREALNTPSSSFARMELMHLCQALVGTCRQYYKVHENSGQSPRQLQITNEFIRLVAQSCPKERKMSFYANKLCISKKYLSSIISTVTGRSASKWVEEYTIQSAKALLCNARISVGDISDQMGFITTSDFCKYFKNATGMTPNEYRRTK